MNEAICTNPVEVIGDMARTNSYESTKRYEASNYDRLSALVRKGDRERIKAHAATLGESLNGFINRAIRETMDRDRLKAAADAAGLTVEEYTRRAALEALRITAGKSAGNPE